MGGMGWRLVSAIGAVSGTSVVRMSTDGIAVDAVYLVEAVRGRYGCFNVDRHLR